MQDFSVVVSDETSGTTRVTAVGELDLASADVLGQALLPTIRADRSVTVDCSRLGFIDSSGLRVLLEAASRAGEVGAELHLAQVQQAVLRVLELAGVTELFSTISTAGGALQE